MSQNTRGVTLFSSITLIFLVLLFIIVVIIVYVLNEFARTAEENVPMIISIANQVDNAIQTIQVLGPNLKSILTNYVDTICVPNQVACPPITDLLLPSFTYAECPVLCGAILASKSVCETLPNNRFCNNIIDPL